jgi:hypothetical protein
MTIKAGGRSALIIATGLFVCFAGPSPAAAAADDNAVTDSKSAATETESAAGEAVAVRKYVRHGSRHWKKHAHRKSSKVAQKSSPKKKVDTTAVAADDGGISTAISPSVANANAQLAAADTPESPSAGNARAMSARANDMLQSAPAGQPADAQPAAETPAVAADQLNDADRTLAAGAAPAPTLAMGMGSQPDATAAASSEEGSGWDQASLIGKIFIGLGSLLTLASAARMLMV